jgi:hypothetical protein
MDLTSLGAMLFSESGAVALLLLAGYVPLAMAIKALWRRNESEAREGRDLMRESIKSDAALAQALALLRERIVGADGREGH